MTNNYLEDGLGLWSEESPLDNPNDDGLWPHSLSEFDYELLEPQESSPSAPIILLSAAFGLLCGIIGFYLFYQILGWRVELTTGIALIILFVGVALSSIGLSYAAHSSAIVSNITFSCGLIMLSVLFFGLCIVTGALGATVVFLLST